MGKALFFLAMLGVTLPVFSQVPEQCIQRQERTLSCPHLAYKRAAMDIPALSITKNKIVCLCLSDLTLADAKNASQLDKIDHQVTLQRIAQKYDLTVEDLVLLVKY
jgi:hypothetical protein